MKFARIIMCFGIVSILSTARGSDDNQTRSDITSDVEKITREKEEFTKALQSQFEKLKGFQNAEKDYFVVGEARGRSARFVVVQGTENATNLIMKIVSERPQSRWQVFGRASTVEDGKKLMASSRSQYSRQMRAILKQRCS